MTTPPHDRDTSPSIAALAIQVSVLSNQVESLTTKLDAFASTQEEDARVLSDIGELRRQVEHILSAVTEEKGDSPPDWFWLTMTDQKRDERLGEFDRPGRDRHPCPVPRLPQWADQALLAEPSQSQMGTRLAVPTLVRCLSGQTANAEGGRRLARPLVSRCTSPSGRHHEPLRNNLLPTPQPPATAVITRALLDTLQVLGCVDFRVDPSDVLGLELGESVVMRNIGGRITPATLRSWALLGRLGQARHTLPPSRLVFGLVYDVNTGLIEIVDPATQE